MTGSNSVNVFLGLGLPWLIANIYEMSNGREQGYYFVPAGSLGFSVVVFIVCALAAVICLLIRRKVVGGELGGSENGRKGSLAFLCFLWGLYILLSILQAYKVGGSFWDDLTFGIQPAECPPEYK